MTDISPEGSAFKNGWWACYLYLRGERPDHYDMRRMEKDWEAFRRERELEDAMARR